ncbi:MAG TPA: HIT family protein [Planctomycetota bacterium]|nr:HIT family protein [Planctomycetota bacterium]
MACELCDGPGGDLLWQDDVCRVVLVGDPQIPGFARVVVGRHAAELTDLDERECARVMRAVFAVEEALRAVLAPHKVNVASLGNVTPHVHWHVIPRWRDDPWFPDPIWAPPRRDAAPRALPDGAREQLARRIADGLAGP